MQPNAGPGIMGIVPLVVIMVFFYFFLIRPESKKRKEHQKMIGGLQKNEEVVTIGGIHGTIVNVKEKTFVVRVDDNTKLELDKSAVAAVKKRKES